MSKTNYMSILSCIDISYDDKTKNIFNNISSDKISDKIINKYINFSVSLDYPLAKYGFQHFIHSIKNDTIKLKEFENKKKVYQVINPFERFIFDYNKSIGELSKEYFELKDKPDILSRGFYKLWEIILMFDLIDINQDNFTSAHLGENEGSFIQATMFYRDMFSTKSKNDKYIAITVNTEDVAGHVPEITDKFINYYNKEKPVRVNIHKITDKKTAEQSGGTFDFIVADGSFEWVNENIQEQEYFKLLFSHIVTCINIQKKGGNFVCKFFETFTMTSMKFLEILRSLYETVYIIKPFTSRPSNSEKYVVCKNFKYAEKDKKLSDIIELLNVLHSKVYQNKGNIVNLFSDFNFDKDFICKMIQINRDITNKQFKAIGEILTFIDSQNYFGDVYKDKREEQIKAAEYWTNLFFMDKKNYKENKTKIQELINKVNKNNIDKVKELNNIIF